MKKLSLVVVLLGIAAMGLVQLRLATAQSPQPPAGATSAAPKARSTSEGETSATEKAVAEGVSTAAASENLQAAKDLDVPFAHREAVIDLNRLFKESHLFQSRKEAMKEKIQRMDEQRKRTVDQFSALEDKIRTTSDDDLKRGLIRELAQDRAALEIDSNRFQQKMRKEEATAYYETYQRIQAEIADYAKQHGIRLVRRTKAVAATKEEPVDPNDPSAVIARLNRDILYSDPQQIDITEPILERLNAERP